jgi:hypothetical protein
VASKDRGDIFEVSELSSYDSDEPTSPVAQAVRRVFGVYVLTRAALLCAAFYGEKVAAVGGLSGLLSGWDGQHYLAVAKYGYPHHPDVATYSRIAFFPIYPLVVRVLSHLTHVSYLGVGEFVSIAAGAAFVVVATMLVARRYDPRTAERAGIVLCVFPGSFVLSLPYAEALALLLVVLALWASERHQSIRAGFFAAVATATSPLMLALVPVMAYRAWRSREPKAYVTLAMTPLGFVGYMIYLDIHTGHLFEWFTEERLGFGHKVDLIAPIQWLQLAPFAGYTEVVCLAIVVWAVWCFVRGRVPLEWWLFSLSIIVVNLFDKSLLVNPRILMNAFPLVLAIGVVATRKNFITIAVGFALVLPLVFLAYMTIGNITTQP